VKDQVSNTLLLHTFQCEIYPLLGFS